MDSTFLTSFSINISEITVYVAIAVVTLIGFFKCIFPLFRNAGLLNRAVVKLEKSTAKGERPLWREARFLGRSLRNEWQQFLLNAAQLDLRGMPCDLREYINEESVIEKPGHSQLADLIPGLLTSLGILGTFMGLMQGLTSVDFTNAEGTIQSIPQLLGGMKFAFATSVAGIACSLVFNMLNRIACGKVERALDDFEDAFYELAMPRPLQPDVQLLCQKQDDDARLVQLADDVANRVASALQVAVSNAMAPLSQSLDTFIHCATREQVDGVRKITDQFVHQLNTAISAEINEISAVFTKVADDQRETQRNMHNTMAAVQNMTQNAQQISHSAADISHQIQKLTKEVQQTCSTQSVVIETAQSAGRDLAVRIQKLNLSLERMQFAVDTLTDELNGVQSENVEIDS